MAKAVPFLSEVESCRELPPAVEARATLRALHVFFGYSSASSLIFAKREAASLRYADVEVRQFFLASRTSLVSLVKELFRFRREIRDFGPHVVHAHYGTVTALFCALATALPLVVTFRGSDLNPCPSMNRLRSLIGRLFSQLAALRTSEIICASKQLRDRLWWRRNGVTIMPGSVDRKLFYPRERCEARMALGWPLPDKMVLFNAGHSPRIKRLDLADAAIAEANKIAGAPEIRMVVLDGQIEPNAIPLYLNAADCLLVTSDWEGSPYIVKEALCCNLPIVSVDVGDVAERVEGITPSRIVARDAKALGAALLEVAMLGCRSNGYLAAADLSEERVAETVRSIYDRVLCPDRAVRIADRLSAE